MSMLRSLQRPLRSVVLAGCAPRRLHAVFPRRSVLLLKSEPSLCRAMRQLQTSAARREEKSAPSTSAPPTEPAAKEEVYEGPLAVTFRRVKIFSISSLALSVLMTPFLFMIETSSAVPLVGRMALAGTVIVTSGVSTALVAWCGRPYVHKMTWIPVDDAAATPSQVAGKSPTGVELVTTTLTLRKRATRVYDTAFLVPTNRPFAKWELAEAFRLPPAEAATEKAKGNLPREETVAETMDHNGKVIGRWIVRWDENGNGLCNEAGKIVRCVCIRSSMILPHIPFLPR